MQNYPLSHFMTALPSESLSSKRGAAERRRGLSQHSEHSTVFKGDDYMDIERAKHIWKLIKGEILKTSLLIG